MSIPLPERRYKTREARNAFFLQLLDRAREIPGLQGIAFSQSVHPFVFFGSRITVPASHVTANTRVRISEISSGYAAMMNLRILQGRVLSDEDVRTARQFAFVNERFATFYFPEGGALGQTVRLN